MEKILPPTSFLDRHNCMDLEEMQYLSQVRKDTIDKKMQVSNKGQETQIWPS